MPIPFLFPSFLFPQPAPSRPARAEKPAVAGCPRKPRNLFNHKDTSATKNPNKFFVFFVPLVVKFFRVKTWLRNTRKFLLNTTTQRSQSRASPAPLLPPSRPMLFGAQTGQSGSRETSLASCSSCPSCLSFSLVKASGLPVGRICKEPLA